MYHILLEQMLGTRLIKFVIENFMVGFSRITASIF